ncbi:hypothetical protein Avbf_08848 [Armadillidium vulgare]|nr:hypothetical protein Avbf_08848 [Armadillidium vulgare]
MRRLFQSKRSKNEKEDDKKKHEERGRKGENEKRGSRRKEEEEDEEEENKDLLITEQNKEPFKKSWMNKCYEKLAYPNPNCLEECGYPRDLSTYRNTDTEMGKYIEEIRGTFGNAFSNHVTLDAFQQFFWWQFFEKKEKERLKLRSGKDLKAVILKDFQDHLRAEMKKQNLPIGTKSVNAKRVDSHVIEDFPPEVFLHDTRAGIKLYDNLLKNKIRGDEDARERYSEELCNPAIFIRKWLGQAFVGVLSLNGMMWAWDQLFMNEWSRPLQEDSIKHFGFDQTLDA